MRATRSDDSDEWASRSAQDDTPFPVILKREALKNPVRRRTCPDQARCSAHGIASLKITDGD